MREHASIPDPNDYHMVRSFLENNPDIVQFGLELLMQMAGSSCPVSTKQAVVDHLGGEANNDMHALGAGFLSLSESRLRKVIRHVLRKKL